MSKRKSALEKIADAKRNILEAEVELEKVIGEIEVSPRAQKTTISKVVKDALTKVRAARAHVDELEKIVEIDTR
jgi:hypothetical protein